MPIADASGVPIHYDLAGSGPPLVLLEGWVGDSTTWRHAGYVDALASQFTLVLVDGRGRGRGGKPHDPTLYTTDHLAADVLGVLDDLGVTAPASLRGQPARRPSLCSRPRSRPRCSPSASTAWRVLSPTWRPPGHCPTGCGR